MVALKQVEKAVQAAKNAAAGFLEKVPSPGSADAEHGEDCGCGRRKAQMVKSLRNGKSAADIVREALADIKGE